MRLMDVFEKKEDTFVKDIMKDIFRNNNLERITKEKSGFKTVRKVVRYEGEYFNGERHGKGKEFSKEGRLIYVGEYFKGERHGKGKEFSKEGRLIYEGEYAYGKWDGKGKQYADEEGSNEPQLLYEGEFKNGKWNGKGKKYEIGLYGGRLEHEGNFVDGKFVG